MSNVMFRFTVVTALVFTAWVSSHSAYAVQPDEIMKDPALEKRARGLSAGLRCLVCQNQSIDDSDAPLARDLRVLVRERLSKGDTDDQIMKLVVDRYGEFVLLRPLFNTRTFILWLATPLILLLALVFLYRAYRQRVGRNENLVPATELSADEQARLESLLKDEN